MCKKFNRTFSIKTNFSVNKNCEEKPKTVSDNNWRSFTNNKTKKKIFETIFAVRHFCVIVKLKEAC